MTVRIKFKWSRERERGEDSTIKPFLEASSYVGKIKILPHLSSTQGDLIY